MNQATNVDSDAVRRPWSRQEVRELRRAYRRGGMQAAVQAFEGRRGAPSVRSKLSRLHVLTETEPFPGGVQMVTVADVVDTLGLSLAGAQRRVEHAPLRIVRSKKTFIPRCHLLAWRAQEDAVLRAVPPTHLTRHEVARLLGGVSPDRAKEVMRRSEVPFVLVREGGRGRPVRAYEREAAAEAIKGALRLWAEVPKYRPKREAK